MPVICEYENKINMIVCLKNFIAYCNNKNLLQAAIIILHELMCDKSLYHDINFVELAQKPEHENDEFIYLYELQSYIDKLNLAGMTNPHE